jgi:hypothetical protein
MDIEETLDRRGRNYGEFINIATTAQDLKSVLKYGVNYSLLEPDMAEALDMIAHKMSRLVNGDCYHRDSWHDIMGYARLIDMKLEKSE